MTVAFFCVFLAIFIPLVLTGYAKFSAKGYDNRSPRDFAAQLQGKAKRAHNAQLNAYEAFPPFAAGVLIAHSAGAAQSQIDLLAALFIVFRIVYSVFYVTDQAGLRSVAWFAAFACIVGLFVISF
jgi:uncharacterized MAPEG superfamily protein